jgi:hypothetical protein
VSLAVAAHVPPRGLEEVRAFYGDVKIERDPQGGWKIISPIGWSTANGVMFHHPLLPRGRLYVNRKILEPLRAALELAHERCPEYAIRTIGCYNARPKRTAGLPAGVVGWPRLSMHAVAAAVDVNAAQNPMGRDLVTDMPETWRSAWLDVGWTWGGDFPKPDAMHWQFGSGV